MARQFVAPAGTLRTAHAAQWQINMRACVRRGARPRVRVAALCAGAAGAVGAAAGAASASAQGSSASQTEAPAWPSTVYRTNSPGALRAVAQVEVRAAADEAAARASWRRAAAAHGWQRGGDAAAKPLVFVVADSLSIDWGPHLQAVLDPVFRYGRKNLNCAKGFCRAWCPTRGEGPKDLVANPGIDGCNGGDSRHALAYIRHLAASTAPQGPQDERLLAPDTTPSRLSGIRADVIILNAGAPLVYHHSPPALPGKVTRSSTPHT